MNLTSSRATTEERTGRLQPLSCQQHASHGHPHIPPSCFTYKLGRKAKNGLFFFLSFCLQPVIRHRCSRILLGSVFACKEHPPNTQFSSLYCRMSQSPPGSFVKTQTTYCFSSCSLSLFCFLLDKMSSWCHMFSPDIVKKEKEKEKAT